MEFVRVAVLSGYFETMAELGTDPRPLLAEQGLSPNLLLNPEHLIPAPAATALLERSAAASGCITLGLRMAQRRSIADLGVTSLLIAHQPTLRHALEALREFRSRINSTLILHFEEHGEEAILREDFSLALPLGARQSRDLALAVLARLCKAALGDSWRPRVVCFTHEALPLAERPILARAFGCEALFNSAFSGIVINRADLDRPNAQANPQLALHARLLLESVMSPAARSTADDVEQLIRLLLPDGRATIQVCAASMGVKLRSLQRALAGEGTSFSALLDRVRRQMATQYLANPRLRITDVADLLGYGSIGAFTRWHGQAFGKPPRAARAAS